MNCPLCDSSGKQLSGDSDEFFSCATCSGIFKNRDYYLDVGKEEARYREHNNDVNDIRYQNFVSPITKYVFENFKQYQRGLDFGSGTAPVISKILQDNGYDICQFDPFFANNVELLKKRYDYIVCCEVVEHFHNPAVEFALLHKMLQTNGALICMTHLYDDSVEFTSWYYKNDPTHVFFYRRETIEFIASSYGFKRFEINNRVFVLQL